MTDAAHATEGREKRRHRPRTGMGVFVTDRELYEFLGVPRDTAERTIKALDSNPHSGFPQKDPLWGGRRHLPSVEAWLKRASERNMPPSRRKR